MQAAGCTVHHCIKPDSSKSAPVTCRLPEAEGRRHDRRRLQPRDVAEGRHALDPARQNMCQGRGVGKRYPVCLEIIKALIKDAAAAKSTRRPYPQESSPLPRDGLVQQLKQRRRRAAPPRHNALNQVAGQRQAPALCDLGDLRGLPYGIPPVCYV